MVALWLREGMGGSVVAHTPPLDMCLLMNTVHLDVPLRGTKNTKPTCSLIPILHLLLIHSKFYTMSVRFLLCTQNVFFSSWIYMSFIPPSFFFWNHFFGIIWLKVSLVQDISVVFARPSAISWTWTTVSSHSPASLASTSFVWSSNFRLPFACFTL